jgi:signal transduction histidine kinase
VSRLYPRAILIYIVTIVIPACGLLWLGIQSFERQRQALATLNSERLAGELEKRTRAAAETAFAQHNHPAAKYWFTMEQGLVVRPALHAPPPLPVPREFLEAEHLELDLNMPAVALDLYRKLLGSNQSKDLALSRMARCLAKLGRHDQARVIWQTLADTYSVSRDLSHRPYGIVAAIEAGQSQGLYEKIASGAWDLAADQAEYFLSELDPKRTTPYLDQFRFARNLNEQFKPERPLQQNETYAYNLGEWRVFYHDEGNDRISGFAVNTDWIDHVLRPQVQRELGITDTAKRSVQVYGGAIAFVLLMLSAGVVLLLRDISREARTNGLRSDFVSSVSHELKTPITLIRLYSETLLRGSGFQEEERPHFYRIIMRESERLGRLVDRIQTFSRVERGDQTYKFEEGDLAPAIGRIVDDYREFLERTGFRVERALPESAPHVRFDATALSQAVINLLDNAVKYSGESRDIAVRLSVLDGGVILEVEDHGIGIPGAEQGRIFERFYRIPNGSGKGGYGLGLFLVRHIMEAHGGRAEVNSELGRGSRFRLVFPIVAQ